MNLLQAHAVLERAFSNPCKSHGKRDPPKAGAAEECILFNFLRALRDCHARQDSAARKGALPDFQHSLRNRHLSLPSQLPDGGAMQSAIRYTVYYRGFVNFKQ